jgi:hypothetical protein
MRDGEGAVTAQQGVDWSVLRASDISRTHSEGARTKGQVERANVAVVKKRGSTPWGEDALDPDLVVLLPRPPMFGPPKALRRLAHEV